MQRFTRFWLQFLDWILPTIQVGEACGSTVLVGFLASDFPQHVRNGAHFSTERGNEASYQE